MISDAVWMEKAVYITCNDGFDDNFGLETIVYLELFLKETTCYLSYSKQTSFNSTYTANNICMPSSFNYLWDCQVTNTRYRKSGNFRIE